MFLKLFVIVSTVLAVKVVAEPPVSSNQEQEISGPYQPSGWRPSGPAFRFPERRPLPLAYGPPQQNPVTLETDNQNKGIEERRYNFGKQVGITYLPPQVKFSNQFQKENYEIEAQVQLNQPRTPFRFPKVTEENQNRGVENQVDLANSVPQDTLSAPRNEPAATYGPPTVESKPGLRRGSKTSDKQYQDQADFQEGSGSGDDDLKYRFLQPNVLPSQPNTGGERNGIEYQVDLTYGAPEETLVVPRNEPAVTYGPPEEEATSTTTESTTTELPTTTESFTEPAQEEDNKYTKSDEENVVRKENLKEEIVDSEGNQEQNVYYIYHPSGLLQRVIYSAQDDQANMAYSAKLKYENIEPIRGPVYTYDSDTYVFRRLY